jgi:DNA-binding beta-propeller fold protein YncE
LGLAVDASGNVYVSQTITGPRIRIFQPNKFELDSIVTDISNPRGIAIDNDGRIIVADGPVVKIFSKLP